MAKIGLVIFDCDGVLIDSEILSAETLIDLLAGYDVAVDLDYVRRHFLGRSFPTVAATLRGNFNLDLPVDFERVYRRRLLEVFARGLKPTPGVIEMLSQLTTPFCVATSSSPERATRSLEIAGLTRFFGDRLYTASEVARGKPAPDLFLHAADCECVAPENCLIVEDSLPGLEAADSAGMTAFHYVGGSHMTGTEAWTGGHSPGRVVFDNWREFADRLAALTR